jgi:hypothetical protein
MHMGLGMGWDWDGKIKGHATLYIPGVQGDITKQLSKLSHLEKELRLFSS